MSLTQRKQPPLQSNARRIRAIGAACFGCILFLCVVTFGAPPRVDLDGSWTQVLAWASINHALWGKDIVFSYGPLGFLHPFSAYQTGIFWPFYIGQILLAGAFALTASALLWRARPPIFFLFGLAVFCSFIWIPGDVAWVMTLLFGTATLLPYGCQRLNIRESVIIVGFAFVAGAIALIKFSLFPLWLLCVGALGLHQFVRTTWRRALITTVILVAGYVLIWIACGQPLANLPAYFLGSLQIASGYGHSMGLAAALDVELAGAAISGLFLLLCACIAWQGRRDAPSMIVAALYAATCFLAWRADFTRADHAPWFFAFMSLLPFGLLCHPALAGLRTLRVGLTALIIATSAAGLYGPGVLAARPHLISGSLREHLDHLLAPKQLLATRDAQWLATTRNVALPDVARNIDNHSVDVFTVDQSIALLNGFNYAPRPVFQSYSAYTPYLSRLNEAYFLGPRAPNFVILKLDAIDSHLPLIEDPLTFIALLERYRPVLIEHGYLLLQLDTAANTSGPVTPPNSWTNAEMGKPIAIPPSPTSASAAFVKLDLTPLGHLYALLLREPALRIVIQTDNGEYDYRMLRLNAAAGFVLSLMVRDTNDWVRLQLGSQLPHAHSFRIRPEKSWQELFFQPTFAVGFKDIDYHHENASDASPAIVALVYPGFNLMPISVHGTSNLIVEDGHPAMFLHAPGALLFNPASGRYQINGRFGIRAEALTTPACSTADGIGMTVLKIHDSTEIPLLHLELDPFHVLGDRGEHGFNIDSVDIESGDRIEYRIDPGHGGNNTVCDWSYVRDMRFERTGDPSD